MSAGAGPIYDIIQAMHHGSQVAERLRHEAEGRAKELKKQVDFFRALEEHAKSWTGPENQGLLGGNALGSLNRLANVLGMEQERAERMAAGFKTLETELYRISKEAEAKIATGPPSSKQLVGELGKRGAKGIGHLAGAGISALGRRLSALEEDPVPVPRLRRAPLGGYGMKEAAPVRRLPIVNRKDIQRGLSMPGERVRKVPPGDYYLDERLGELRNVMNPNIHVRLNEFEVEYFRQRAH